MPWIAHRRRGSKLGHHSFWIALVTPPLLPLALSTWSLWHLSVLSLALRSKPARAFNSSRRSNDTDGDSAVPRHTFLSSSLRPASASTLTAGPLLCL